MITLIWKARRKIMALVRSHGLWKVKDPTPEQIPGLIQKVIAIIPTIINIVLEHVSDEKFIEIITSDRRVLRRVHSRILGLFPVEITVNDGLLGPFATT